MKARIAYLPGDGIGVEVLHEARKVLEVIASEHNQGVFLTMDLGREYDINGLVGNLRKFVSVEA